MRECYPITSLANFTNARLPHLTFVFASERYGYWYSPRTRTHQHARLRARERGEVSPRSTRRERRRILAPAVGEGATARVSFSSACARGRVFDRPKVLVAGVSVARAAARRFHERARGPSRRLAPRAHHGSVRLPPARGRRGRRRRRLPRLQGANLHEGANDLPRARAGLSPEDPRPHPRPRRGDRRGPIPRTASGGRDGDRRRDSPAPTVDAHRARPARGAAPSSLLEASTRRRARHRARDEKARTYAKLRAFADAMPRRDRITPIVAPRRDVPAAPAALSAAFEDAVADADFTWADARPSPTSSRTTSSTEPSMATARWVRRRRSRR